MSNNGSKTVYFTPVDDVSNRSALSFPSINIASRRLLQFIYPVSQHSINPMYTTLTRCGAAACSIDDVEHASGAFDARLINRYRDPRLFYRRYLNVLNPLKIARHYELNMVYQDERKLIKLLLVRNTLAYIFCSRSCSMNTVLRCIWDSKDRTLSL